MNSPIIIAALQSGALGAVSSILGQTISCYRTNQAWSLNATDLVHFMLFSVFNCPPNYIWQSWLEAQFPAYADKLAPRGKEALVDDAVTGSSTSTDLNEKAGVCDRNARAKAAMTEASKQTGATPKTLNLRNTAIKFALDQTIGAAINTVLFIAGIALLRGHSWESISNDLRNQFWPMIFAGQKLWPAVSILSFTLIPLEHRTLFGSVMGLFWGVYLSLLSSGKTS